MTDIVEKLRGSDRRYPGITHLCHPLELLDEAADEIEILRLAFQGLEDEKNAEIERLRYRIIELESERGPYSQAQLLAMKVARGE